MMRLRQIVRGVQPALIVAVFMLVPSLSATQKQPVKKTATKAQTSATARKAPAKKTTRRVVRRVRYRRPSRPSADRIEQIQKALARSGFYQGDPSGKWDSKTIKAMKSFQQAHGITPTGKIDATSLQQLGLGSDVAGVAPPRPLIAADRSGSSE